MNTRFARIRRLTVRAFAVGLLLAVVLAAAACPHAGHFLIVDEPIEPSDAIVVLAGTRVVRWLEAGELYRERQAPAIVVSPGIIERAELRLPEMGISFPSEAALVTEGLLQMGIPSSAISTFPAGVDNTAEEAALARALAEQRGWKSLIVVTSKYHTKRSRFAFEREMKGSGIRVQVRGSRYDDIQPDTWWKSRKDARFVTWELQKLAAYWLGLAI